MSLVHADNFNIYGSDTSNMLDGAYASIGGVSLVADPDGVSPARVVALTAGDRLLRYVLKNPTSKVGAAQRVWCFTLPHSDAVRPSLMTWRNGSNVVLGYIIVTTTGSIQAWIKNVGTNVYTMVGDTVVPVITAAGWFHVEAALTAGTGTAEIEVRVEGITRISETGLTTDGAVIYQIGQEGHQGGTGDGITVFFKDYVVWDGDGTMNNDFLGACVVSELLPASDVTAGGWASTGADIFGVLDNNPPLDAQYISADDAPPSFCEVTLTNLQADVTSVRGLVSVVRAGKVDGGDGNLQVSIRSGGDLSEGEDRPITASQLYWADVHELDPDTSAPWTPGKVDAATLVIDRTV